MILEPQKHGTYHMDEYAAIPRNPMSVWTGYTSSNVQMGYLDLFGPGLLCLRAWVLTAPFATMASISLVEPAVLSIWMVAACRWCRLGCRRRISARGQPISGASHCQLSEQ